jgi:hypothetical protein
VTPNDEPGRTLMERGKPTRQWHGEDQPAAHSPTEKDGGRIKSAHKTEQKTIGTKYKLNQNQKKGTTHMSNKTRFFS